MDGTDTKKDETSEKVYRFGGHYLHSGVRRIFKEGRFLRVTPKSFDVLEFLVSNAGKTVTKDDLLESVWKGSFVEEGNLAVHVSKLRKIVSPEDPDLMIRTIPGSGYRFVGEVTETSHEEWKDQVKDTVPAFEELPLLDDDRESIAVLPLWNENGDEGLDYLADGLTEALINNLSCNSKLRVIARNTVFRFKGKEVDVQEVGRRLNVTSVLTGRLRVIGDDLLIGVELGLVEDARQLWGAQINQPFAEIFEIQDKITDSIAHTLSIEIDKASSLRAGQRHTKNTESYRLYLKGLYLKNNRRSVKEINKAADLFRKSISFDPHFAKSFVELANCHRILFLYQQVSKEEAMTQVESLISIASGIGEDFPEYHMAVGYLKMFMRFDFVGAEENFRRAIVLNPNHAKAHLYLSRLLVYSGRLSDGLVEAAEAIALDPISLDGNKITAKIFFMSGQFESAVTRLEECLELEPENFEALVLLGTCKIELKEFQDAEELFLRALAIQDHLETHSMLGYLYGMNNKKKLAKEKLEYLRGLQEHSYVPATYFAVICAALGDTDSAIEYLNKGFEERYVDIVAIKVDPRWRNIRDDERFMQLQTQLWNSDTSGK